jgi:hypothetical protein
LSPPLAAIVPDGAMVSLFEACSASICVNAEQFAALRLTISLPVQLLCRFLHAGCSPTPGKC